MRLVTEANVQDRQGARTLLAALATRFRRLREADYECLPETTKALIHIAMIRLIVRQLLT